MVLLIRYGLRMSSSFKTTFTRFGQIVKQIKSTANGGLLLNLRPIAERTCGRIRPILDISSWRFIYDQYHNGPLLAACHSEIAQLQIRYQNP